MSNLNLNSMSNDNKRIFDYFIVTGLPPKLTAKSGVDSDQVLEKDQHRKLLLKNIEMDLYHANNEKKDPIVDIAIMKRTLNEGIPNGYECIWNTPSNYSANLCCEIVKKNEMYLLIRRGYDKPPIADIGVYYEGIETVREGCTIIKETIGNNSANLNTSSLNAKRVFITYRRLTDLACNCLAMIDVCVINKGQGEKAPHTFNEIPKNLNVGYLGPSMALCYKKSWIPAPQIKYSPSILYRYPQTDHSDLPFPSEMAYFGLPMGATIESWPKTNSQSPKNVSLSDLKPVFSTFVLNVNSEDGSIVEKVYGSVITFYEDFDQNCLNEDQCEMLKFNNSYQSRTLHSNKSLVILSRHPIFETYKSFLFFLFNKYTKKVNIKSSEDLIIPIERYLSYLVFEVPFPTAKKSRVLVHLTDWDTDNLTVNLPSEIVLPQSGASFADLLYNLKVENSINVFLFAILQKNLMIHSLRRCVLTSVVEAISSIIFPFVWRYSYLPMCPLSLCQLTEAPGSFIIGMDTRFFDYFDLPYNVICVDLDTNTISWTEDRHKINPNILPRNIKNNLKDRLEKILEGITKLNIEKNSIQEPTKNQETDFKKRLRNFELSIREAFLKAMACFLSDYKTFLRTATRRPDLKAKDRNIIKYFDTEKFLASKQSAEKLFYQELIRTQLFYDCIMNLSFTSELDPALAQSFMVFSDICSKMNPNSYRDDEIKLISLNNSNDSQTIVMLPPQLDAEFLNHLNPILTNMDPKDIIINGSAFIYDDKENSFPKLKIEVYSNYNSNTNSSLDLDASIGSKNDHLLIEDLRKNSLKLSDSNRIETQSNSSSITQNLSRKSNKMLNTPMGIRTKAEKIQALKRMESKINFKSTNSIKQAQKNYNTLAKLHAYCFLSNAYALWFIYLPEYLKECEDLKKNALDYAYMVLTQMQKHNLNHPDEICYRIMMQLCFLYKFPLLAVRTFLHIRKYKIDISPITYSFYNKALIETDNWPTFDQDKWGKIRLIWLVVCKFRQNLRIKYEREQKTHAKMRPKQHKRKGKKSSKPTKMRIISKNDQNMSAIQNSEIKFKLSMQNLDNKPCKPIAKSSTSKHMSHLLFLNSTGLIFSYEQPKQNKRTIRKYFSISDDLDKLKVSVNFMDSAKKKFSHNQMTDPLGALSKDPGVGKEIERTVENEDVKKRLFDYKPFENKSDFIYDKKTNSSNDQNISYDSDLYSDDLYDDSDEQDFEEDESIDFEGDSDVEVDSAHFNLNSREGSDKLSQLKISQDSENGSQTPETKKNSSFLNAGLSPFLSGLKKKLENSIELSGSRLKTAQKFVTDKSMEFKEAIISSSNQNEIASKVRSFSAYNFKTKQYLTDFVKSTSSFSIKQNSGNDYLTANGDANDRADGLIRMHDFFNLDPLLIDENFEPKCLAWWKIDQRLNHRFDPRANDRLLDVHMSTCNYCEKCNSYLYDEEIMSGWTLNDSDLNIKCLRCSYSIVPNIYIKIKDFEKMKKMLMHKDEDRELNDENSKIEAHPFNEIDATKKSKIKSQAEFPTIIETHELTVQYLSPLVIRKELENIILNENQDNEYVCFFDENFMQNHSIIFWNLIWYYKRIGVDCSCLENILLNHRVKLLAQKENLTIEGNCFEYKNIFSNLSLYEYHTHPYVRVFCLWDNLDLHNQKQNFEIPLYISWLRKNYKSFLNDSRFRLVTVLNPDDLINMKKTSINDSGLSKLFDLILRNVKDNEITDPFSNLVRDRFIAKRNFNSIYREILFLIIVALERELIDIDAFDTEYKDAFKNLISNNILKEKLVLDHPPNHIAVWCRRLFSPLLV